MTRQVKKKLSLGEGNILETRVKVTKMSSDLFIFPLQSLAFFLSYCCGDYLPFGFYYSYSRLPMTARVIVFVSALPPRSYPIIP